MKKLSCVLTLLFCGFVVAQQTRPRLPSTTFANLNSGGSTANGVEVYCTDCNKNTDPCTSGGTGAVAERINGAWVCGTSSSAPPAGSDKYVQFNDGGSFGGDSGFQFDKTPKTVTLTKSTNHGTVSGSLTARNLNATNSPTATLQGGGTFNFIALDNLVSISGLTLGDSSETAINANAYGTNNVISGTATVNDTNGTGGVNLTFAPVHGAVDVTTSVTSAPDGVDGIVAGGRFSSALTHSNSGGGVLSAYGVYAEASGSLNTSGHDHVGGYFLSQGLGQSNYGTEVVVLPDATNNYGVFITSSLTSGANNYAIRSESGAQSSFAGPVTVPTLTTTGARNHFFTSISTNITLGTHYFVAVDASGGNRTETLPTCNSGLSGRTYLIKKTDSSANTVTVARAGSDTIDGGTQLIFEYAGKARGVICDGAGGWWVQ